MSIFTLLYPVTSGDDLIYICSICEQNGLPANGGLAGSDEVGCCSVCDRTEESEDFL